MNERSERLLAWRGRTIPAVDSDRRLGRGIVATLVIGSYMAIGFALGLHAEAYLLAGIPITIAFQVLVARRPLRSLWLRDGPPMAFTARSAIAVIVVAIAPAVVAAGAVRDGNIATAGWGIAGMVGAIGAVYGIRAMDRAAVRSTIIATVGSASVLVVVMVAYRLASGGFDGDVMAALATAAISLATYLPVVFVMEEVLFRGLLDPYLHGSTAGPDHATTLLGSALWGIWHLPVAAISLGMLTIPYLVIVHGVLGYFLVTAWRRTGNLAAPGIAHAVSDALRNAVAVL